jgi:hypothetical protein
MFTKLESLRAKIMEGQIVRSRRRWVRRTVVAVVLATVAVIGQSTAAYADVIAEGPGVRARGDWDWQTQNLTNVELSVRDLACDGSDVGVRLKIYHTNGTSESTQLRRNRTGCGTFTNWTGLAWVDVLPIAGVRVVGCVTEGNRCYESPYHDNPRT